MQAAGLKEQRSGTQWGKGPLHCILQPSKKLLNSPQKQAMQQTPEEVSPSQEAGVARYDDG